MGFGLSLINCRKNAPFTNYVSETSEVLNVELLQCDSRERQKVGCTPAVLRGHTKENTKGRSFGVFLLDITLFLVYYG